MMEAEDIHATLDFNSALTRLIAGEVFSTFIRHASLKSTRSSVPLFTTNFYVYGPL
jgi:hypothetical protein